MESGSRQPLPWPNSKSSWREWRCREMALQSADSPAGRKSLGWEHTCLQPPQVDSIRRAKKNLPVTTPREAHRKRAYCPDGFSNLRSLQGKTSCCARHVAWVCKPVRRPQIQIGFWRNCGFLPDVSNGEKASNASFLRNSNTVPCS